MADNQNVSTNLNERNTADEFRQESQIATMLFEEEMLIMKTEVKEEVFDFENPVHDIEYVNVKEEYNPLIKNNFETEDMKFINSREQSLNENHVSGNSQLREDLQQKQKLSKEGLHLKHNNVERRNYFKRPILEKQDEELKKFKCADCKYTTNHKQALEQHIRIHTNDRPFKCTYKNCECIAGQEESCKCSMCGYAAAQKITLKMHILTKHSAEPKKYKCVDCSFATHIKYKLKQHIRVHTNERPYKCMYKNCECTAEQEESCKCSMCEYAATEKAILNMHILTKHSAQPKKYKCANCNYAAHKKFQLEQHIRIHTNERPFKCTYKNCKCTASQKEPCECSMCEYTTALKDSLKLHILVKHSGEPKKYKCTHCKYAAHQKQILNRHMRIHANDRAFKCMYKNCKCTVGQEQSCNCDMCGYAAINASTLKAHILTKHNTEPKKYKCADCDYACHQNYQLQRHMRIHTNNKSFK